MKKLYNHLKMLYCMLKKSKKQNIVQLEPGEVQRLREDHGCCAYKQQSDAAMTPNVSTKPRIGGIAAALVCLPIHWWAGRRDDVLCYANCFVPAQRAPPSVKNGMPVTSTPFSVC
jgi:hypothetical protein